LWERANSGLTLLQIGATVWLAGWVCSFVLVLIVLYLTIGEGGDRRSSTDAWHLLRQSQLLAQATAILGAPLLFLFGRNSFNDVPQLARARSLSWAAWVGTWMQVFVAVVVAGLLVFSSSLDFTGTPFRLLMIAGFLLPILWGVTEVLFTRALSSVGTFICESDKYEQPRPTNKVARAVAIFWGGTILAFLMGVGTMWFRLRDVRSTSPGTAGFAPFLLGQAVFHLVLVLAGYLYLGVLRAGKKAIQQQTGEQVAL